MYFFRFHTCSLLSKLHALPTSPTHHKTGTRVLNKRPSPVSYLASYFSVQIPFKLRFNLFFIPQHKNHKLLSITGVEVVDASSSFCSSITRFASLVFRVTSILRAVLVHQQQNKWYPQRCLLAHLEATLDFSCSEFTWT